MLTDVYSLNDQLVQLIDRGGSKAIEKEMPDEWVDWLSIAGNSEDCVRGITNQFEAGSTSVVLCVVPSEDLSGQLEMLSKKVLPRF